jgi:hypothetical protein
MKKLLLIASLVLGTVAQARVQVATGVVQFNIEKAEFAPAHASNPGNGTVTVNYDKGTVNLFVVRQSTCPAGMMCALAMPAPIIVELPITTVSVDSCGVKHVVASKDMRPVDGALEKLSVTDASAMKNCMTFVQVVSNATYETRFYSRENGQEIVAQSTMTLALKNSSLAPAILVRLDQNSGFAPVPSSKTLYIDVTGRVLLTVKQFNNSEAATVNLAQLSQEALVNLKALVTGLASQKGKLVDLNNGEPMCMDAPSSSLSVSANGKNMVVRRLEGCHTISLQDYRAEQLSQLMEGLESLAK